MSGIPVDRIKLGQYWAHGPLYGAESFLLYIRGVEARPTERLRRIDLREYSAAQGWVDCGWLAFDVGSRAMVDLGEWHEVKERDLLWPYFGTGEERIVRRCVGPSEVLIAIKRGQELEGDLPWRLQ